MSQDCNDRNGTTVNTSVRVTVDLRDRFEAVIKAEDPETDVSKELRRYMRRRVAQAEGQAA